VTGPRVAVVGTSGSGKTWLARRLAERLGAAHVELDALQHGPGWAQATPAELRNRTVAALAATDAWVVDGNYDVTRDLVWPQATALVWLDYPRWFVMSRVVRRSVARAVTRRELWNGNREDWRGWFDADHPIRWAWSTHAERRARYTQFSAAPEWSHLRVVRLARPRQARRLLAAIAEPTR